MFNFNAQNIDVESALQNNSKKSVIRTDSEEQLQTSLFNKCSFCNCVIRTHSFKDIGHKHHFCDIYCAKLFHDNHERIKPDIIEYNKAFVNKQLDKSATEAFLKMKNTLFEMLPVYKPREDDICFGDPINMKIKYRNCIKLDFVR